MGVHVPGYEEIEEHVEAEEVHRARCNECGWVGDDHDEMGWKDAEQDALDHWETDCEFNEQDEDE